LLAPCLDYWQKDVRSFCGGFAGAGPGHVAEDKERVVSKRQPTQTELEAMRFGWRVSNM